MTKRAPAGAASTAVLCLFVLASVSLLGCLATYASPLWGQAGTASSGRVPAGPSRLISWRAARQIIRSGKVKHAGQNRSLGVFLVTKDGVTYYARQPRIDDLRKAIDTLAPNKDEIRYETE